MKKLWKLILSGIVTLGIAGCSSATNTNKGMNSSTSDENNGGKVLVVYFSATGNTERVAKEIALVTNADTFEVVPAAEYTNEDLKWTNENSRVSREHEDTSLQKVELTSTTVENWDSYDTVFIGYPIWWGNAAWPINGFVEANDFTNKTVYPFATSASSGIGQSATNLSKLTDNGEWKEGQRFSSGATEDEVDSWVNGLNLQ